MWTSGRIAQFGFFMLASTVTFAADAVSTSSEPDQSQQVAKPASLPVTPYSAHLLPDARFSSFSAGGRHAGSFGAMGLRDDSVLARLGEIRNLSLLTLSATRRTRIFLGVNADGLVGLHFVAFADDGDEQYLSLARLPYLKKKTARK